MLMNFGFLFEFFEFYNLKLCNCVVMVLMIWNFLLGNVFNEEVVNYYWCCVENGVGLLIIEGIMVNYLGVNGYLNVLVFYGDVVLVGWKDVVDVVYEVGGVIFLQFWYVGVVCKVGVELDLLVLGYSLFGLFVLGKFNGKVMIQDDIEDVIIVFVDVVQDVKVFGFDGVEIYGVYGYLLDQFLWEGINQCDDEYGGSMENCLCFVVEIVEVVCYWVGLEFLIMLWFFQWKQQDYEVCLVNSLQELEVFL